MQGRYYGELVTIQFKRGDEYFIVYEDSTEEFVPSSDVTDIQKPKKPQKRIKPNRKRKLNNFKKHFYSKERVEKINSMPCAICHVTPSENAHIKTRGAGGTWEDIIPMCKAHHAEQHQIGNKSFETKYQITLTEIVKNYKHIIA